MALTDNDDPVIGALLSGGNSPVPESLPCGNLKSGLTPSSRQALGRLPQIHSEATETATLARFLGSAVGAAAALMVMGGVAVIFASGATLQQEFVWSLLVLVGVGAMLRCYITSIAQAFDRAPLREAAKDLRAVLFYTGSAWGAGAFLLLGNNPVPITGLCFAVLPTILLVLLLRDRAAGLGFVAPVTVLTAAAIILQPWSNEGVALAMLLIVQGSIALALSLPGRTPANLPAGLSLR